MLTNDRLWKLDAAKTGPKCQNGRQVKLANRVRAAIRKGPKTALPDKLFTLPVTLLICILLVEFLKIIV